MVRALNILIADDDVDNAASLGELFEMEGHNAIVVHSGDAAVAAYKVHEFDLAFMDVMMPGKNGVESFLEIRKLCPNAKVYMMTGYSVEQLLRQATDNGAMGVLNKPIDIEKVSSALRDAGAHGIVVVAEDDPDFGNHLVRIVNEGGYVCELVKTSKHLAFHSSTLTPSIMIFDLKKPLIDGFEVLNDLKRAGRNVPAIIITATGSQYHDTIEAMQDIRVTGILNKPFDPMLLLDQLENLAA
jgi:two-component system, NtrC family, response regulator HydG